MSTTRLSFLPNPHPQGRGHRVAVACVVPPPLGRAHPPRAVLPLCLRRGGFAFTDVCGDDRANPRRTAGGWVGGWVGGLEGESPTPPAPPDHAPKKQSANQRPNQKIHILFYFVNFDFPHLTSPHLAHLTLPHRAAPALYRCGIYPTSSICLTSCQGHAIGAPLLWS